MSATSLRDQMPETAAWVDRMRTAHGRVYVNDLIRRAQPPTREPGLFYAIESGHVLGTPFPAGTDIAQWQDRALAWGVKFAGFMKLPDGKVAHGAD